MSNNVVDLNAYKNNCAMHEALALVRDLASSPIEWRVRNCCLRSMANHDLSIPDVINILRTGFAIGDFAGPRTLAVSGKSVDGDHFSVGIHVTSGPPIIRVLKIWKGSVSLQKQSA